jgi:hypothetical protein
MQRSQIAASHPVLNTLAFNPLTATPQQEVQAAQGLEQATYGGPLSALGQQWAQDNANAAAQEKYISGLYTGLNQFNQQALANEGQIAGDLNSTLAGIGAQEAQQLQGIGQNAQQSLGQFVKNDPSVMNAGQQALTQNLQQQQGMATQDMAALRGLGATQGANWQQLVNANTGAFTRAGQQLIGQVGAQNQANLGKIQAARQAINAKAGDLLASDLYKIRQQDASQRIAAAGIGLKGDALAQALAIANQKNATSIANNKRNNATSAANNAANNRTRLTVAQMQQNAAARKAGKGPIYTPTGQRVVSAADQGKMAGDIQAIAKLVGPNDSITIPAQPATATKAAVPAQTLTKQEINQYLLNGKNPNGKKYTQPIIDAGLEYALLGWLTPQTVTELNKAGYIVGNALPRTPDNTAGNRRT